MKGSYSWSCNYNFFFQFLCSWKYRNVFLHTFKIKLNNPLYVLWLNYHDDHDHDVVMQWSKITSYRDYLRNLSISGESDQPFAISFEDVAAAAYRIRKGVAKSPCEVRVFYYCNDEVLHQHSNETSSRQNIFTSENQHTRTRRHRFVF